jgi:hypothetical protein
MCGRATNLRLEGIRSEARGRLGVGINGSGGPLCCKLIAKKELTRLLRTLSPLEAHLYYHWVNTGPVMRQ